MGLARVAVRIKTVVVGWSEVVTMADTPAVSRQGLIDVPLANGSLSSLSPIIFGSVRFYHSIMAGPNIGVAVNDGSRRLSIFGVTTAAAGQLRTPPPHAPEVLTRPDKAGQWVAHPQDSYSATRNLVRFFPPERAISPIYYFRVTFREARS